MLNIKIHLQNVDLNSAAHGAAPLEGSGSGTATLVAPAAAQQHWWLTPSIHVLFLLGTAH